MISHPGVMELSEWVLAHGEQLLYVTYFGLLALLAVVEVRRPGYAGVAERRRRWPSNFGLTALNVLLPPLVPLSVLAAAQWAELHDIGVLHRFTGIAPWLSVAFTLLARSLTSYVNHRLMHKLPLLWRLHRVHHADTHLDVSTTVRFHPLEFFPSLLLQLVTVVMLGLTPWVLVLYEILDGAVNLFTHANVRPPAWLDRAMRWLFVTPDMHRVHHSAWQPETDSNFGAVFSFWDRLFGTYVRAPAAGYATMRIGLDGVHPRDAASFRWQLQSAFVREDSRRA